jgi:hypothetical protein
MRNLKTLAARVLEGCEGVEQGGGTHMNTPPTHTPPSTPEKNTVPDGCPAFRALGGGTLEHASQDYITVDAEELLRPDVRSCWACGSTTWWTDSYSVNHCAVCHPERREK